MICPIQIALGAQWHGLYILWSVKSLKVPSQMACTFKEAGTTIPKEKGSQWSGMPQRGSSSTQEDKRQRKALRLIKGSLWARCTVVDVLVYGPRQLSHMPRAPGFPLGVLSHSVFMVLLGVN